MSSELAIAQAERVKGFVELIVQFSKLQEPERRLPEPKRLAECK
jgi:hypothetical protein